MECPNIKNRDTLLKYPYFLSIYLIALYLLSYSEFFVFQQPRSSAATTVTFLTSSFIFPVIFTNFVETEKLYKVPKFKDF